MNINAAKDQRIIKIATEVMADIANSLPPGHSITLEIHKKLVDAARKMALEEGL